MPYFLEPSNEISTFISVYFSRQVKKTESFVKKGQRGLPKKSYIVISIIRLSFHKIKLGEFLLKVDY